MELKLKKTRDETFPAKLKSNQIEYLFSEIEIEGGTNKMDCCTCYVNYFVCPSFTVSQKKSG